jgi:hypothetical protein
MVRLSPGLVVTVRAAALLALALAATASAATAQPGAAGGLRLVTQIGTIDGPAAYAFGRVNAVELLPGGAVAVSDLQASEVRIFDAAGRFVRAVGGLGAGPGEFRAPSRIIVRQADFLVYDSALRRYSRFSFDGRHLGELGDGVLLRHGFTVLFEGGRFSTTDAQELARNPRALPPHMNERLLVGRPGVLPWDTLLVSRGGAVWLYGGGGQQSLLPFHFGPGIGWAIHGDSVLATVDAMQGIVRFYSVQPSGPVIRRTVPLGLAQQPVTPAAVRALEERTRRENPRRAPAAGAVRIPPPFSALVGPPRFDDAGNLWLPRWYNAADSVNTGEHLIVSPAGRVSRQRLPRGFVLHAIRGDRVAGVVRDEFDVQYVRVYRIGM